LVSYFVVMPAFGSGGGNGYRAVAALAGGSDGSLTVETVWRVLWPGAVSYVYQLMKPVAFTVLADPATVFLAPIALINSVLAVAFHGTPLKINSYQSSLVPAILAVSLLGATRVARWFEWTGVPHRVLNLTVLGLGLPLAILSTKDVLSVSLGRLRSDIEFALPDELVRIIPPGASVAAPGNALPTLATREALYWVERAPDYPAPVRPDFVIVSGLEVEWERQDILQGPEPRRRYAWFLAGLPTSGYRRIWSGRGYTLYAK
jgi:Predicted membrane protein (DUF2079)